MSRLYFRAARASATAAIACLSLVPTLAGAAGITLAAKSGGFDIEGELTSFDGTTYVIETAAGPMTLTASSYRCVSDVCPSRPVAPQPAPSVLASSAVAAGAGPQRIVIAGSSTIGRELMPDLVRAFAASRRQPTEDLVGGAVNETELVLGATDAHAKTTVALAVHGSKAGIAALARDEATFAMADRPLTIDEQTQLRSARNQNVRTDVLGVDGIAVVVGTGVGTRVLTAQQIGRVFAGQVTNWSELGFTAGPITLYAPEQGQDTMDVFIDTMLKPYGLAMSASAVLGGSHAERMRKLERDPFGISFMSLTAVDEARTIDITSTCGLPVRATRFALKAEEYPMSRRLHLYSQLPIAPVADALAAYAISPAGQNLVANNGFVDLGIEAVPLAHEADRLRAPLRATAAPQEVAARAQLLADLQGYKRLSVTVRFAPSTSALDAPSRLDLERLNALLKTPAYLSKSVLLAGYTDPVGTVPVNLALAKKRADQVRSLILARAEGTRPADSVIARGYGPIAPVVCNDTPDGQMRNRRVEVWVKD